MGVGKFIKVKPQYERDCNISPIGKQLISEYYLQKGESSPQDAFTRAANCWSFGDSNLAQRLYDYASKQWFGFASPVLSNAINIDWPSDDFKTNSAWLKEWVKTNPVKAQPISCFLSYMADTREGIVDTWAETAWLTYAGGGVGLHAKLRSNEGKSTGVISNLHVTDAQMLACKQGDVRRGSAAVYLDISHPEFKEYLHMRRIGGDPKRKNFNLHNAVCITDSFMKAVITDDLWTFVDPASNIEYDKVSARELWREILQVRSETGEPYLFFTDTANKALNQAQKDLCLRIHGSNLCVVPETQILTECGYYPIKELENQQVTVWNGEEWSDVIVRRTGESVNVLKVKTNSGQILECTPEHKFYILCEHSPKYSGKEKVVEAKDLKSGDRLIKHDLPLIQGEKELHKAYTNGFYSGDGCFTKQGQRIYLYGEKRKLKDAIEVNNTTKWYIQEDFDREYCHLFDLKEKFFVPDASYTIDSRIKWLAGYFDADGTLLSFNRSESIQVGSVEPEFLREVQLMLQTLGVESKITLNRESGEYPLPANDGTGHLKNFKCKAAYRLILNGAAVYSLWLLGLRTNRLKLSGKKPQRDARHFITIDSVVDEGRVSDTYCFSEPKKHKGMFNGIITGQCNEIFLPTNEERTAVCCLSSPNIEKYDEWKDTNMIKDIVRALDNVLEFFICTAPEGMKKAVFSATKERSIGVGVMGFHSYLQSKGIPFESGGFNSAAQLNYEVFKKIKNDCYEESEQLGKERGFPDDCIPLKRRNANLIAIAPTANNSLIVGTSPSIEPWNSNCFIQNTRAGDFVIKNKYLQKLFDEKGFDEETQQKLWNDIVQHEGSVQQLKELSKQEKDVFKTAFELNQDWIIEHAASRQPLICQGQSVNLFFNSGADKGYVERVHFNAWKKGLKGLYYFRTKSKVKAEKVQNKIEREGLVDGTTANTTTCLSCEG